MRLYLRAACEISGSLSGDSGGIVSHYDTLRVVPWAEDAVIQGAYRALMRLYHPDTNPDPEAQSRAREITRAFAVLGDPEKRAAYDALPRLGDEPEPGLFTAYQRPAPPMRNLGIASIALALAVSVGVAVWPQSVPREGPQALRNGTTTPIAKHAASARNLVAGSAKVAAHVNEGGRTDTALVRDLKPQVSVSEQSTSRSQPIPKQAEAQAVVAEPPPSLPLPKREIAQLVKPKTPAPTATDRASTDASQSADDRHAQVERLAASFLKQSLEHADFRKQELLLSASNRSALSRTLCHSSDCVTETYLRQIRETTEIMQGRIPTP